MISFKQWLSEYGYQIGKMAGASGNLDVQPNSRGMNIKSRYVHNQIKNNKTIFPKKLFGKKKKMKK